MKRKRISRSPCFRTFHAVRRIVLRSSPLHRRSLQERQEVPEALAAREASAVPEA